MKIQVKPFNKELSDFDIQLLLVLNTLNTDLWNLNAYLGIHSLKEKDHIKINNLFLLLKNLEFDSRMTALDFMINSRVIFDETDPEEGSSSIINYISTLDYLLTSIPDNILKSIDEFNKEIV